jgi:hypothetical protein
MSTNKNIDTINRLLEQASSRHVFDTNTEKMAYELGYLMGLLATLMNEDSLIFHSVKSKLDKPK